MKKIALLLLISISFFGCSNLEDCINGDFIPTQHLEEIGCPDTRFTLYVPSLMNQNAFKIYRDAYTASREIEGICNLNAIDFTRYELLIGQVWIESTNFKANYVYIEKCNGKKELTVELYQNRGGRAQFLTYHAIIPKTFGHTPIVNTKIITP